MSTSQIAGPDTVGQMVARVLARAHQAAMDIGEPGEARAILDVAQSFAEELAAADAAFDRLEFLEAVTQSVA